MRGHRRGMLLLSAAVFRDSGTMPAAGEVSPPPLPRSLVLTTEDRSIVVSRLARACLHFQDTFLSRKGSPAGLLCQVRALQGPLRRCRRPAPAMGATLFRVQPEQPAYRAQARLCRSPLLLHGVGSSGAQTSVHCSDSPEGMAARGGGRKPDCAEDEGEG